MTAHSLTGWSWSALVDLFDGDEDRALAALPTMPGLGSYHDEVHHRGPSRPVVVEDPVVRSRRLCGFDGHVRAVRNGRLPDGSHRLVCGECVARRQRRRRLIASGGV